ncbi:hypothetical protein HYDPIDRAFT_84836 [Hydnomerulius pinastri MD-312]|nr:hypothetical protein HYDPIDRAFT_84836 [Hydnomerulius pinastri MD-312]
MDLNSARLITPVPDGPELLAALLAAGDIDEISDAEDFASVGNYVNGIGHSSRGKTAVGLVFWLYPTGLHGPTRKLEDGTIEYHGILVTVEPGVDVKEIIDGLRNRLTKVGGQKVPMEGIGHHHFAASK